eukprot:2722970-Lingulodinium_polyedra.AAC.1
MDLRPVETSRQWCHTIFNKAQAEMDADAVAHHTEVWTGVQHAIDVTLLAAIIKHNSLSPPSPGSARRAAEYKGYEM